MSESLPVIYQDDHLVAVHKPSGLLVHRSLIDTRETRFAVQIVRDQIGRRVYPVHRLDRPTSGVLLFALSSEVARQLSEQFAGRGVEKSYLALVRGFAPSEGRIDSPLHEQHDRIADALADAGKDAQEAVTDFRRLATAELPHAVGRYPSARYSLMEMRPLTGRRHQIRRHLKRLNHPIVGDVRHGDRHHNHFFAAHSGCRRLLLAATEVRLRHPVSGEPLNLQAPLQGCFRDVVLSLGWASALPGWMIRHQT